MNSLARIVALVTCLSPLPATGPASAQSQPPAADVNFQVPLNLTSLHPAVTKVRVSCSLLADQDSPLHEQRTGEVEIPVAGRQVVTTAQVVVVVPATSFGSGDGVAGAATPPAQPYECELHGFSSAFGWRKFDRYEISEYRTSNNVTRSHVGTFFW